MRQPSPSRSLLGALAVLALAVVTCAAAMADPPTWGTKEQRMSDIAARIGLILPQAARVVGVREEAGIDQLVQLKLKTDAAGLEQFLAANRLDSAAFEDMQRALLLPDAGWWDPSQAASLPTVQIRRPGGPTLNIGYASKPGGAVDLYIM